MTTLEDRVRATLREETITVSDDLADRVLARVDAQRRHRHGLVLTCAVVAVLVAVCTILVAIAGRPGTVTSVPATRAPETPAGTGIYPTPTSVPAYVAALDEWVSCLREQGVRVSGPDKDYFVSVNPDPDLEAGRNACAHLTPALSDDVERQLQARAAGLPHVPRDSGPRAPLDP